MNKKALFVVEGKRDEEYAKAICSKMEIDVRVFPVQANIYMLFSKLEKEDFNLNIVDALLEMQSIDESDRKMLLEEQPFAYTYLLFDMDPHDNARTLHENMMIIDEMLDRFKDETDNTVGKLYINYPMVESLWDYDKKNPDEYQSRKIEFKNIKKYKAIVGKRGSSMNYSKYSIELFSALAIMNVKKANFLVRGNWEKPPYTDYLKELEQKKIFNNISRQVEMNSDVPILNSLPLFMIDYWGNQNGFYDSL